MWHTKNIKEIEKELRTNIKTGLGDKDVQIRQDEFGKNKIEEGKKESLLVKFLNQFKDFSMCQVNVGNFFIFFSNLFCNV